MKNGKVDFVKVRVGARNLEKVEILEGLKAGLQDFDTSYFTRARESAQYCLLGKLYINREPTYFGIGLRYVLGRKRSMSMSLLGITLASLSLS